MKNIFLGNNEYKIYFYLMSYSSSSKVKIIFINIKFCLNIYANKNI